MTVALFEQSLVWTATGTQCNKGSSPNFAFTTTEIK